MHHPLLTSALRKLPAPLAQAVRRRVHQYSGGRRGSYSHDAEDRFVLDYFKGKSDGWYVDVGANDPIVMSNTYLLYRKGWRGITVDPVPYLVEAQRKFRPEDICVHAALGPVEGQLTFYEIDHAGLSTLDKDRADALIAEGHHLRRTYPVAIRTLQSIIDEHAKSRTVDFLTIDAEGRDLGVVQGADWDRFRPQLVVYEHDSPHPDPIGEILLSKRYRLFRRIGVNNFMERIG